MKRKQASHESVDIGKMRRFSGSCGFGAGSLGGSGTT
jgi:hypothetical protein